MMMDTISIFEKPDFVRYMIFFFDFFCEFFLLFCNIYDQKMHKNFVT